MMNFVINAENLTKIYRDQVARNKAYIDIKHRKTYGFSG